MRDSDEEYPLHQPQRNRYRGPFDDENEPEFEDEEEAPRSRRRRRHQPLQQREVPLAAALPEGRLRKALTIGVIAGVLCTLQHLIIVLVNASRYKTYNPTAIPNHPTSIDCR